jgi:plastocyanin
MSRRPQRLRVLTCSLVFLALSGEIGSALAGAAADSPLTLHVEIRSFAFVPARLKARAGDTVEWTNHDFVPHTATANGGGWTTIALTQGASGRIVVRSSGVIAYHCQYHPEMVGALIVAAGE